MAEQAAAQVAKGALRRLAQSQREPTPENFARAYAEEAGREPHVIPHRARPLIERIAARVYDDADARTRAVASLMRGDWDAAGRSIDQASAAAGARGQAWAGLIGRVARAVAAGSRAWTPARRRDGLERLLAGSASDPARLQQRLQALLSAWEHDPPPDGGTADPDAATASVDPSPTVTGQAWPAAARDLGQTVAASLASGEARTAELAADFDHALAALTLQGPTPEVTRALGHILARVRRGLGHRHRMYDDLAALCRELGQGLTELAEDESWARGQSEALLAQLADGPSARGVRAATELLHETRSRQGRVRAERRAADRALEDVIRQLLAELGDLGAQTGRFEASVGRHVQAIESADSLQSLTGVVRELLDDSRAVHDTVQRSNQRLHDDRTRAAELQERVQALEADLELLSSEASTDALTRVANRRGLDRAFAALAGRDGGIAVALLDIDNFKRLNDELGHAAGDQALKALAATVQARLRPQDTVARFGGEEFVLLLPELPVEQAQHDLTRLQRSLTTGLFMHDGEQVLVTFSAGVTAWREGETLDTALERSDEALYEAKRSGKNRTCIA